MIPHISPKAKSMLAADLLWCRVGDHILSISKRRKTSQSDSGKESMKAQVH